MQDENLTAIVFLLAISTILILVAVCFIAGILVLHQKKQFYYLKELDRLKVTYEKDMLKLHLEIQEQTFENISQEIHDNIGQVLTLAKFHLNSVDIRNLDKTADQVRSSVKLLTEAITDLSDISRSLSSNIILQNGLLRALEFEFERINHLESVHISFVTMGEAVFMEAQQDLIVFRIVQEALSNVIRHSMASSVQICIQYFDSFLEIEIVDNGKGFNLCDLEQREFRINSGIGNMEKRTKTLNGKFSICAVEGLGTRINIRVPYKNSNDE